MQKCLGVIDFFNRVIEDIFVRYRCAEKVIGSSVFIILLYVLHF